MTLLSLVPQRRVVRAIVNNRRLRMVGWIWLGRVIAGPDLYDDGAAP